MYACNKLLYEIASYYNQIFHLLVIPLKINILSVSNTYINGATLPVYLLEQDGTLVPLKFRSFNTLLTFPFSAQLAIMSFRMITTLKSQSRRAIRPSLMRTQAMHRSR